MPTEVADVLFSSRVQNLSLKANKCPRLPLILPACFNSFIHSPLSAFDFPSLLSLCVQPRPGWTWTEVRYITAGDRLQAQASRPFQLHPFCALRQGPCLSICVFGRLSSVLTLVSKPDLAASTFRASPSLFHQTERWRFSWEECFRSEETFL